MFLQHKNCAGAEPLLLVSYEGMKEREVEIPPPGKTRLTEGLERLVQLYDGWGKKEKVEMWRKKRDASKATK